MTTTAAPTPTRRKSDGLVIDGLALGGSALLSAVAGFLSWLVAARTQPQAVVSTASAFVSAFILVASLAELSLVTGTWDALVVLGGQGAAGRTLVLVLGVGFLYACVANIVTWSLGANRVAAAAAAEGALPAVLGRLHPRHHTPHAAFVVMGAVSTALLVGNALLSSRADNVFWMIFRLSGVCFLVSYLLLFPAFLFLRWEAGYLGRQHPVLPAAPGFARKVKPLVRLGERELAAYCVLEGIDYIVEECPMAVGNKHLGYKEMLNTIEERSPGTKASFLFGFLERGHPRFVGEADDERAALNPCASCGSPTPGDLCAFCRLQARATEAVR